MARIREFETLNSELMRQSDGLSSENNLMVATNGDLRERYSALFAKHQEVEAEYKTVKNAIATSQVEFNRLSLEISFLKEERTRLLDLIDGKNDVLGKLLKRFEAVKTCYEVTKGEEMFSKDLVVHLETLLGAAFKQRQCLEGKMESTRNEFEKLHSELHDVIRKGKISFYEKMQA